MAERSLREELEAAAKGDAAEGATPVVAEAPAAAPGEALDGAEAAVAPQDAPKAPDALSGPQERGPDGKFLKKPDTQGQASADAPPASPDTETAAAAAKPEPQAQPETIRVPHALPAPLKAEFGDLPEKWRDAFIKQEDSIKAFKDEQAPKAARLNRYDEILGPHLDKWRMSGLDEFSGVQTLLAAQNILERNPVDGLVHIARSYGVNPQQIAQALGLPPGQAQATAPGGQPAPTQPDLSAALQPYVQRVQTLEQQLQADRQATESANLARITDEVHAFANDPANLYYANVEQRMAALISSKQATSLKDAYEQACWMDPEIRPLLLKAQAPAPAPAVDPAKQAAELARRKAEQARSASGSVTGAPAPGAQPAREPPGSVRDSIRAAMQEIGAPV